MCVCVKFVVLHIATVCVEAGKVRVLVPLVDENSVTLGSERIGKWVDNVTI